MNGWSIGIAAVILSSISASASGEVLSGWRFWRVVTASGNPVCSMGVTPKSGDTVKNVFVRKLGKSNRLNITMYKDSWNIPRGTTLATTIDFMDNQPLTISAYGDGKIVDIDLPESYTAVFLDLIKDSKFLQVGFPSGSEPTWTVSLKGVTSPLKKFVECALQDGKRNTQPF